MTRRRSAILAIALSLGLVLGACGDDSSPSATDDAADTETDASGFTVQVSQSGIEMPGEVTGGVVHVKLESDIEGAEANFSKVKPGTTEDQFKQAIVGVVSGGPFPDFLEATTGVLGEGGGGGGESTLVLPEGDYIAWSIPEPPDEGEGDEEGGTATTAAAAGETARGQAEEEPEGEGGGGPPPEAVLTKSFKAKAGEPGDLPGTDGNEIVAREYSFDVKVKDGAKEFTFRNEGPDQFHHVVLFDFGDLAPAVVEENLPAFFEGGEDAPPPPAFKDVKFDELEAGDGPVLSPGLAAVVPAAGFESGTTYAAVCFISDRTGGPPHAISKGMRTVFTVE
ncbi:MAG TPA: hypothetical protein VMY88_10065 [Acidimicrobiales bacterium]|nr:hypothetical protein [Acidimicrobiales bacterium]